MTENTKQVDIKRILRGLFRALMVLFYITLFIGGIVIFVLGYKYIVDPRMKFDFLGIVLPLWGITLIGEIILLGIGGYGCIIGLKMIYNIIRKQPYQLRRAPKIFPFAILIFAIVGVNYYFPFWTVNLGIQSKYSPHIGYYGENGMSISWDTNNLQRSIIKWGNTRENLQEAEGGATAFNLGGTSNHHIVVLRDLLPGTTYYYQIPALGSKVYQIRTAPTFASGENVTFTMIADTHSNFPVHRQTIRTMMADPDQPDYMCIVGDLVNQDDYMENWAMIFNSEGYGKLMPTIPMMVTSGNHEAGCREQGCERRKNFKTFFQYDLPGNYTKVEGAEDIGFYYSYNFSNVHMVVLDIKENGSVFTPQQIEWVKNDLARAQNMWKFVSFHYNLYSLADSEPNLEMARILEPIFKDYQVDATFWGHDHLFESYLTNGNESWGGTYGFMVGGGGGGQPEMTNRAIFKNHTWPDIVLTPEKKGTQFDHIYGSQYHLYSELVNHYMKVQVSGDVATFTAIRVMDGTIIKQYVVNR